MKAFLLFVFFTVNVSLFSQNIADSVQWISIEEAGKLFGEQQLFQIRKLQII